MLTYDAEQQVESMITDGRRIVDAARSQYQPVAICAAYSSGDDSSVSTHFLMTNYPGCFVFNADTMVGLSPSRRHLKAVCEQFRWDLEIQQATAEGPPKDMLIARNDGSGRKKKVPFDPASLPGGRWSDGSTLYEETVLNHGFPGPGMHGICYRRLKERPLRRTIRRLRRPRTTEKVMIISGIRHDESSRRAGYQRAVEVGDSGSVWVNPFYWRSAADFEAYREEFGIPRNPVKRRCGISGECCCGAFGNAIVERPAYREADPAFADYLDNLQARVTANGFPWCWGGSPPQWWLDGRRGQSFLFDVEPENFQPMCVGCNNGRR